MQLPQHIVLLPENATISLDRTFNLKTMEIQHTLFAYARHDCCRKAEQIRFLPMEPEQYRVLYPQFFTNFTSRLNSIRTTAG